MEMGKDQGWAILDLEAMQGLSGRAHLNQIKNEEMGQQVKKGRPRREEASQQFHRVTAEQWAGQDEVWEASRHQITPGFIRASCLEVWFYPKRKGKVKSA